MSENEILKEVERLKKKFINYGLKEQTIREAFAGNEIISCFYCKTPNMYERSFNRKSNWSMYECGACDKTFLMDWDNKNNWYNRQGEKQ